jgi:hypothetical protein
VELDCRGPLALRGRRFAKAAALDVFLADVIRRAQEWTKCYAGKSGVRFSRRL